MTSYLIIQPNGNYSCWSAVSDSLFGIDTKPENAWRILRVANGCSPEKAREIADEQISNIQDTGVAYHYAMGWLEVCDFLEGLAEPKEGKPNEDAIATLAKIKRLEINRYDLMKIPQYKTRSQRYQIWLEKYVAKSERLERDAKLLKRSIYRLRQRIASLGDHIE